MFTLLNCTDKLREYFINQYIRLIVQTDYVVCETLSGTKHGKIALLPTVVSYY